MSITYPLALPASLSSVAASAVLHGEPIVAVNRNPFTGRQESFEWGGIWRLEVGLIPMRRSAAAPWLAFFSSLKGPAGSFLAGVPGVAGVTGIGSPSVAGASQTGSTLDISGLTPSTSGIIPASTLFSLGTGTNTHLHRVLSAVTSDGSGEATLDIWPSLRLSPEDASAIEFEAPVGQWLLESAGVPESLEPWGLDTNGDPDPLVSLAFSAREAV